MQKKSTDELMKILREKQTYDEFLSECDSELVYNISTYLNTLVSNRPIADLSKRSGLSESYLYKLLEGKRCNPSRDTLLQICFGLTLDVDCSNMLLRAGNFNILYPRIKRDSIIIFCLEKKLTLIECNHMLLDADERLFNKTKISQMTQLLQEEQADEVQ